MCLRIVFAINFFVLISLSLSAQQSPSGIKWKSIDTGTYEIIFPEELQSLGQRVANLMVHYEKYNYKSIKTNTRKIPIVLINNYAEANGFVSYAPFYSHWFTTPASFDSLEWFKGLAIHEGRHMVQVNKMYYRDGLLYILFGDIGPAIYTILYIPGWFMEGDAVLMETALTKGGRGRIPAFDMWHRTLELSDIRYSYHQSYLGSYKSLYPYSDHYRLGYLLCTYVRKHFGVDVWDRVISRIGTSFSTLIFSSALYEETGMSIEEMYLKAMDEYREIWSNQKNGLLFTEADILNQTDDKRWESFYSPVVDEQYGILAVDFSREKIPSLVQIESGKKAGRVANLPYSIVLSFLHHEKNLSAGSGKLLWREQVPDPRWGYRTWSDLRLFDITSGKSELITEKRKFITSTISKDGTTAAGIEYGSDLKYFLSVIDISSRSELLRTEIKDKGYLFDISISDDKKSITFSALADEGNAILHYNIETGKITEAVKYTHKERLRSPVFFQKAIIYQSDYSGIDNVYAVDMVSGKRYQITSRPFGAFFPSVSNDKLYFNDYSKNGYQAASMILDRKKWTPIEKIKIRSINYIDEIAEQELENDNGAVDNIPSDEYPVRDYRHLKNVVNPFGWYWFPLSFLLRSKDANISLLALSKNVLHTTDIVLDYTYNYNEKMSSGNATLIYSGLYPVFTIKGGYGGRAVYLYDQSEELNRDIYKTWSEAKAGGGISFPLNFSRGRHFTYIEFGSGIEYLKLYNQNDVDYEMYDNMKADGVLNSVNYHITCSSIHPGALDSVIPGTGGDISILYIHTPFEGEYRGSQFSSTLNLYLPGITDLQGFKFSGSYEKIKYDTYIFPQRVLFPRGYQSVRYEQFYNATADYRFPVINFPLVISEKHSIYISRIWKLLYFRRINGDLFFDYGYGKTGNRDVVYRSFGGELTMEHNLLSNMYLALEIGARYSYCIDYKNSESGDKRVVELVLKTPL